MNKKLVISKTILFVLIVGFVIGFKKVFGPENVLIGVTTITAMLMFLERDLTLNPVKNTFKLILINLFIGLAAFLANQNMWLAIPINFLTLFIICYLFCDDLQKPMYLPFGLQYLFILATPISIHKLPLRLVSLIIGAIFIMLLQLIFNKNKVSNKGNSILSNVCSDLIYKIQLMEDNKNNSQLDVKIIKSINEFRKLIYDRRKDDFYLTEEGRIKLNISVALEKIYLLLSKIDSVEDMKEILDNLNFALENFKNVLDGKGNNVSLNNIYEELIEKYEKDNIEDILKLEIISNIGFLYDSLDELNKLKKEHYNIIRKLEEFSGEFKESKENLKKLKTSSIRFSYAFRIAIGIAVGGFIIDFFNFQEGRWMLFTIFSLVNPLYELGQQKTKDRLIATFIGSLIILCLFSIFKDITIRTLLLMLPGYIGSYTNKYRYNMICVTVAAIGAVAVVSGNTQMFTLERIGFVTLGAIFSILINRFILPYKVEDANRDLKRLYKNVIDEMLKNVYKLIKGDKNDNTIKNLFIMTSLIEDKLNLNNQALNDNASYTFIEEERMLVSNIYELYMWINKNKSKEVDKNFILEIIKKMDKDSNVDIILIKESIKDHIENTKNINDKLILSIIVEILAKINKIDEIAIAS